MSNIQQTFRAAWVIPIDGDPICDGIVSVDRDVITAVEPFRADHDHSNLTDIGDAAIVPGLVNAHTHLEFSHLAEPLGQLGMRFTDWIRLVVASRSVSDGLHAKRNAIALGLRESWQAGTWVLGEIATAPVANENYFVGDNLVVDNVAEINRICKVVFHEQLGRSATQFPEKLEQVISFVKSSRSGPDSVLAGISPHAPYSVHPELLTLLCGAAVEGEFNLPVAMHVAETKAERELLDSQNGEFVSMLKDFGAWDESTFQPPVSILDMLKTLANVERSLIIHGNYLNDEEIDFIAQHSGRMSVVYCPRTHLFFGHERHPIKKLMGAGINVAIGTDSRASNPDLNLFSDLKCVAEQFPEFSTTEILKMGTLGGARALGVSPTFGTIQIGRPAALSQIKPDEKSKNGSGRVRQSLNWLLDPSATCGPLV